MNKKFNHHWVASAKVFVLLLQAMLLPIQSNAFISKKIVSVKASAFIGTRPTSPVKIKHKPLTNLSHIKKRKIIIMGEAGQDLSPKDRPFESCNTPFSDPGQPSDRQVRVRVFYRFVASTDPLDTNSVPLIELPAIEGRDPLGFAFEIPTSSGTNRVLQYRIVAEQLKLVGGVPTVNGAARTFPETTTADPNPLQNVNILSNASALFGPDGGRFILGDSNPADGETTIDIPSGLFGSPTTLSVDEVSLTASEDGPAQANPIIPAGIDAISVFNISSDAPIRGFVKISLLYPDFEYPAGQDGVVDGTNIQEKNLRIMWWDGFMWRPLGGTVDTQRNTVTVRTGVFGTFAVVAAPPLSPEDRRPMEKVFTPNGDGKNDVILFSFGDLSEDITVNIFDITGHQVRTLHSQSTSQWDGRDDSGKVVESGVYIYQYEVDGKRISGVCAVAK